MYLIVAREGAHYRVVGTATTREEAERAMAMHAERARTWTTGTVFVLAKVEGG